MISVIIPAYNAQAYLRDCLDSVCGQTYVDWEAIVVDDGSTDSTLAIAREYAGKDDRFKIVSKSNGGQADARNFGLDYAEGEWVTFLDSDDMLYPSSLSVMVRYASAGCDVVAGEFVRGAVYVQPCSSKSESRCISGIEAMREGLFQTGLNASVCSKLFRSEALGRVRFRKGVWYEDLDYFARLFPEIESVVVISDAVYFYRDNPYSFINTFSSKRFDMLTVTEEIERTVSFSYPELLSAARDRRLSANFNMFGLLSIHDSEGRYKQVKEQCWQLIKSYRLSSLMNRDVRIKNKLGILVSMFGKRFLALCSRVFYR